MELDYHAIGIRIKAARAEKGVTQEYVAEKVGLSTPHMSNVETGSTKLGLPTIVAIANVLLVSVDELLCDNVLCSKPVFEREAKAIFEDCSDYEVRLIVDILKAAKNAIRKDCELRRRLEQS